MCELDKKNEKKDPVLKSWMAPTLIDLKLDKTATGSTNVDENQVGSGAFS